MKAADFGSIVVMVEFAPTLPPHEITEWSDDADCFTFKRRQPSATDKVGCRGDMVIFRDSDKSAEFGIKVFQTSPSNRYLNAGLALLESDDASVFVPCSISFIDTSRQDSIVGIQGYIQKVPDISRGKDVKTQEWMIIVENGSADFGDPVFSAFVTAAAAGQ